MSDYLYWSASKIANEIRLGKVSSLEIVKACFDRIDKVNPKINAVVQLVRERAISEAIALDRLTAKGQFKGALHGVPISIKDSLDTEGIISTGGTMGRKHFIPAVDAPVVARLRAAGAVLIAKTNTPELTLSAETNNLIYGRTNNPFDLDRSPGGSSGGSAATIAVGGSFLELGSDTGGSIREPAHLCGITGIKPTAGRTPRTGHIVPYGGGALDSLTQIGPMARYVDDLALTLPIICGPDNADPSCVPVPVNSPDKIDLSQLRIAYYTDNGVVEACSDITRVVSEVASEIKKTGLNIKQHQFPGLKNLAQLSKQLRESVGEGLILRLLERNGTTEHGPDLDGYFISGSDHSNERLDPYLLEQIDEAKSQALQFMANYDAILCPPAKEIARPHRASHRDVFDDWSYMMMQNLLGWPGVTVRAGTSLENDLPVGIQIFAAPWREDVVLALAKKVELLFGGFKRPNI